MGIDQKLTCLEWSIVRQASLNRDKPRRFSDQYIREEKAKIEQYREIFREIFKFMQHKEYVNDYQGEFNVPLFMRNTTFTNEALVREVASIIKTNQVAPLMVGQRVLAIHPKTRELRSATLLTSDVETYHA